MSWTRKADMQGESASNDRSGHAIPKSGMDFPCFAANLGARDAPAHTVHAEHKESRQTMSDSEVKSSNNPPHFLRVKTLPTSRMLATSVDN